MKIAVELYQIIPESSGGIVPQLDNLLSRAFALAPDTTFLVYATPRSLRPAEPLPSNVRLTVFPETNFWRKLELALLEEAADVMFRTYPGTESILFPASRQIILVPDLQHELSPEFFSPEVLEARRQAFPALINNAGAICVYSEHSRQILRERYPASPAKIVLVPPGPNLQLLNADLSLTPAEEALIPQEPFFLYPANLWPHKNHQRLCTALEIARPQLPTGTSLILTGDPAGWPELKAAYPTLPVQHLGFVSPGLLQALYRRATALTYFSLYEGFGMPLVEAFALGTPVLCSNLPVLKEVGGAAVLSCDPTQPEAMAGLMERISQDAELRRTLIEEGYRQARNYSGDASSQQFVEACKMLAEQPVEYRAQLQIFEATLKKLASVQQEVESKEQVIGELNTANRQRLDLINNLNSSLDDLKTTGQAQQTYLQQSQEQIRAKEDELESVRQEFQAAIKFREATEQRLEEKEKVITELKEARKQLDLTIEENREQVKARDEELETLSLELQKVIEIRQTEFELSEQEKLRLTAEIEKLHRWASGGDPSAIIGVVDNPAKTAIWKDWVAIQGWTYSTNSEIDSIEAFIDETSLGVIHYRYPRPDVVEVYKHLPSNIDYGFEAVIKLPESIRPGPHKLRIQIRDDQGNRRDFYKTGYAVPRKNARQPQPFSRKFMPGARPTFKLKTWLRYQVSPERRQAVNDQLNEQYSYWKTHLFHYHLGTLQHHPPRTWKIPARYNHTRPPARPPSISIVTPSYNQAGFLEKTLLSVLDQNYPKLEFIVQDGGSKDSSAEILQRYSDRLTYWESARDKGQSNAINLGFQRATGEIMAYLNSDDLLLPGALNYIARYFEKHPKVEVVYGQRVIIDENNQEIGRWIVPPHRHDEPDDTDILSWADYIPQETMFWRRRIWDKVGGQIDENFQFAMDWDLILRFRAAKARFARLPRFLGAFRVHSTQKSSAQISDLGTREMYHLRERSLGYVPTGLEVHLHTLPYLHRHVFYHKLYRLGLLRY